MLDAALDKFTPVRFELCFVWDELTHRQAPELVPRYPQEQATTTGGSSGGG
jgi:hypothetical protein